MNLLDRLCAGTWDIDDSAMTRIREVIERHDDGIKLDPTQIRSAIGRAPKTPNPRDRAYDIHQGVAIVPVQGMIYKHTSQVQDVSGPSGTSYESILAEVRTAMADSDVRSVLLHVESPGGMTDGNIESSRAIAAAGAAAGKPIWSLIDGLGASAGYSQAIAGARVYATPSSQVGSVGSPMPSGSSTACRPSSIRSWAPAATSLAKPSPRSATAACTWPPRPRGWATSTASPRSSRCSR